MEEGVVQVSTAATTPINTTILRGNVVTTSLTTESNNVISVYSLGQNASADTNISGIQMGCLKETIICKRNR
jgi:hypothetical protein